MTNWRVSWLAIEVVLLIDVNEVWLLLEDPGLGLELEREGRVEDRVGAGLAATEELDGVAAMPADRLADREGRVEGEDERLRHVPLGVGLALHLQMLLRVEVPEDREAADLEARAAEFDIPFVIVRRHSADAAPWPIPNTVEAPEPRSFLPPPPGQ